MALARVAGRLRLRVGEGLAKSGRDSFGRSGLSAIVFGVLRVSGAGLRP
jgi:hypothetical protein